MKWRWTAGLLAVLFLGMGGFFSAFHQCGGDPGMPHQQCLACSWHHDAKFDLPGTTSVAAPQERLLTLLIDAPLEPVAPLQIRHSNRGPPLLS